VLRILGGIGRGINERNRVKNTMLIAQFLCSVDHASRYSRVMKTNLRHYLSSVYFVNQPQQVSGIFVAHYIYIYIYTHTHIHTQ